MIRDQRSSISRRAQNIFKFTPLNSKKIQIKTLGSENSKVKSVQQINFFIKATDKKLIKTIAYTDPLICLPLQNQPLQIAQKRSEHLNLYFAGNGNLDGEIDLLIGSDDYRCFLAREEIGA